MIWGFEKGMMQDAIELKLEYPAKIANDLLDDNIDVGLVPVAILPSMKEYYFISDYCIGSRDEVASVCLFSQVPIDQIEFIYLDYQSRTSVALLKVLLEKFWLKSVQLMDALPGYENKISGNVAALVIGDRALTVRNRVSYIYDLGHTWKTMTGLPFVYATWVSNKKLPEKFIKAFNTATAAGLDHLVEIVRDHPFQDYDLYAYYTRNIDYTFDEDKKAALTLFLEYIN